MSKSEIRNANKKMRFLMEKEEVTVKSKAAAELFLSSEIYKDCSCVMLYMPLGNETDTSDIIKKAFSDGKKVVFPVTDENSGEITPCIADENSEFSKGAFSVYEPCHVKVADIAEIDVIVVPGIAFDRSGSRIGFGKGCYDRLLEKSSAVKIGFCYDFQICGRIPSDEFDIPMDYIITENEIIECIV